jgi:5-methyltetrahydropteroyltriglutamate--homocysteine methyltransferase
MKDAADWGVAALERAAAASAARPRSTSCYGYGIKANVDWEGDARGRVAPVRAGVPALAKSRISQVSLECYHSHVRPS